MYRKPAQTPKAKEAKPKKSKRGTKRSLRNTQKTRQTHGEVCLPIILTVQNTGNKTMLEVEFTEAYERDFKIKQEVFKQKLQTVTKESYNR